MVNDEGPAPHDNDMRQIRIRDYLISNCSKAFTWQETSMSRLWHQHSWGILTMSGPLIQQRSDHVSIVNGTEYFTYVPRVGGYSTNLYESMERRLQLEQFIEILGGLGTATYDPYEVKPYF